MYLSTKTDRITFFIYKFELYYRLFFNNFNIIDLRILIPNVIYKKFINFLKKLSKLISMGHKIFFYK
jgi:hypothetical protein